MSLKRDVIATIPANDLGRAQRFYHDKLGMTNPVESPGGLLYNTGTGSFFLYPTPHAGTAKHTVAAWETENIRKEISDLESRGVIFEEYDTPELKTVNSVATFGPDLGAWFRDSEGNILGIFQRGK